MLQSLSSNKGKGYLQLDVDDKAVGVELVRRAGNGDLNGASCSGSGSTDEEALLVKPADERHGSPSPAPSEIIEINDFQDLIQVLKAYDKKWRPKVIAVFLVVAIIVAVVLAFNPGGEVDVRHKKPDLCHWKGKRLPQGYFQVHSYSLLLALGQQLLSPEAKPNATFLGQATVNLTLLQPTKCLLLHAAALEISRLNITIHHPGKSKDSGHQQPTCLCGQTPGCHSRSCAAFIIALHPGSDLLAIPLHKPQPKGSTVQLAAAYTGQVAPVEGQKGLFRSQPYPLPSGGSAVLLSTQLELYNARRLFPSLDEPAYKAAFSVQLAVPPGVQALSNMPQANRGPYSGPLAAGEKLELVSFQPSPQMSTYTLGIAVGPLTHMAATTKSSKKEVTVWAPPGREEHLKVPLRVAVAALEFYEQWTGVVLPLPKFDLVAVPGRQGAMESWGALLFDPERMLVNPATEGAWGVWRSADVICHELAHQWFGNYVTCSAEEEMLVNEGVASMMEYGCVQTAVPALSSVLLMNEATNPLGNPLGVHEGARQHALQTDADPWAPPIRGANSSAPFSVQTYSKGAALLTMAGSYLESISPGCLQVGLRQYLQQYALGSATVEALLRALAEACPDTYVEPGALPSGEPATFEREVFVQGMLQWTQEPGYPLLRVGEDDPVVLTQERFCGWQKLAPDLHSSSCPSTLPFWYLPMAIGPLAASPLPPTAGDDSVDAGTNSSTMSTSAIQVVVMTAVEWELPEEVDAEVGWWVVQKGGLGGVFRVVYPRLQRASLREALLQLDIVGTGASDGASPRELRRQAAAASEAATLVDDILQVALGATAADKVPYIPAAEALQWIQTALTLPAASTGVAGYALVMPALRALHRLADLLAGEPGCASDLRRFASQLLAPHASRLLQATPRAQASLEYLWQAKGGARDAAFRRLLLPPLLTLSAFMGDVNTSAALCMSRPSASPTPSTPAVAAELQDTAALIAAARPRGCNASLPNSGYQALLADWVKQWQQQGDEATAQRALAALTHAAAAGLLEQQPHGQDILRALLSLPGDGTSLPGLWPSKAVGHVASVCHVAHLLGGGSACGDAVLQVVRSNWQQLESSWGSDTVWQLLEEVAAVGVTTPQQYAALRQWLLPKHAGAAVPSGGAQVPPAAGAGSAAEQEREERALRVLSRAHAGVVWRSQQQLATCEWLQKWQQSR